MAWDDMGTIFVETLIGVAPETGQYYPSAVNGFSSRSVKVVVVRNPYREIDPAVGSLAPVIVIEAINDPITGLWSGPVDAGGVDTGGDEFEIPLDPGDPPRRFTIARQLDSDAGMTKWELR